MRTVEYPYFQPSFDEFNPAQAAVIPYVTSDCNMVVCFGTAVGKTVIAECAFGYYAACVPDKKVVYVCPTKSLASEKLAVWSAVQDFSNKGIAVATGDVRDSLDDHLKAWMSIMTVESFDSKTRSRYWREWVKSVGCVVYDEAHIVDQKGRGDALECSVMAVTAVVPEARIIALSATLGNPKDLAGWLKSLNGKKTMCFQSNWRPHDMAISVVPVQRGLMNGEILRLLGESAGKKRIVFVHSKRYGADLVKYLRKNGISCAAHNASVKAGTRKKIEAYFPSSLSGLDVIVATSTLGVGVNLGVSRG